MKIEDNREIIYKGKYDVIVVGGGIAGASAAISAARSGAKTLLLEKSVYLGGLATSGLINWYEPLCDGKGEQMIFGIAEELIHLSIKYSYDDLPKIWGGSGNSGRTRYATHFSPTVFMLALEDYVKQNGVNIRFDSIGVCPIMKENICTGILVESASGREYFECKTIVDASGDASVCAKAGVPTVVGKNVLTYFCQYYECDDADKIKETKNAGDFRKAIGVGADYSVDKEPLQSFDGTSSDDINKFLEIGKRGLFEKLKQKQRESFDVMMLPGMPQLRTIRRIVGDKDFCAIDGEKYEDSIGSCGDFRSNGIGKRYEIPFGALKNSGFPNIFAAGRIISAPQGDGWEVARVIPVCALTGEAAGKAAAIAAKENI